MFLLLIKSVYIFVELFKSRILFIYLFIHLPHRIKYCYRNFYKDYIFTEKEELQ